jgi:cell wall-associated NlpC family hydrolase
MYYFDLLGKKFEYGATGPDAYDCKGLMIELFKRINVKFPAYDSSDEPTVQSERFAEGLAKYAIPISVPETCCLVMFKIHPPFISHVGMMLNPTQFIHITQNSSVTVERIDSLQWQRKIAGFYRLLA